MDKDVASIIKSLKSNKYSPIYLLQGEEPFYIDYISDFIEENALKEEEKGFNLIVLYGKDVDVNTVVQNARQFPMMAERRVIIVKEAQEITDLGRKEGQEALQCYAEKPTPSTILVLAHKYKALDSRKKATKEIAKAGIVYTSKKIWENQLVTWINNHVKEQGYLMNDKAKILIAESIGTDLSRIANEIKKITVNLKEGEEINEQHVQDYIGISKDFNVFELQKALSYKNASKVYQIINYFGENPKSHPIIPVLANLFSYFNKLLMGIELKIRSEADAKSKLGLNYFNAKDFISALRNYKYPKALEIIDAIQVADMQTKGIDAPRMNEKEIYKELIIKILN